MVSVNLNVMMMITVVNNNFVSVRMSVDNWVFSDNDRFSSDDSNIFFSSVGVSDNLRFWLLWGNLSNMDFVSMTQSEEVSKDIVIWWQRVLDKLLSGWSFLWLDSQAFLN